MTANGEAAYAELLVLARQLYARRSTGLVISYQQLDPNHVEGNCHWNAGLCARDNPSWKVVHGWLVFDYTTTPYFPLPFVQFNPHSVVERSNGARIDPTPGFEAISVS